LKPAPGTADLSSRNEVWTIHPDSYPVDFRAADRTVLL